MLPFERGDGAVALAFFFWVVSWGGGVGDGERGKEGGGKGVKREWDGEEGVVER